MRPPAWLRGWSSSPLPRWATVVVAIGLILAGLSLALYNEQMGAAQKHRAVTVQAQILSGSVAAALAFDDRATVREYIDALRANPDLEAVGVYDAQGGLVAGYAAGRAPLPRSNGAGPLASDGEHVVVTAPVVQGGARLGSVYLRSTREPLSRRAAGYSGIGLLIVMASLVVTVLGASNRSLSRAHHRLQGEMRRRAKAERDLRRSQELEAATQLTLATERGHAALRQSEQRLEFALDAGRLGSWELDLKTGALAASAFFRAAFGLGPDDLLDDRNALITHVHSSDRQRLQRALARAIADKSDLEVEFRTVTPQEEVRWLLMRGRAAYDDQGLAVKMAGLSLDITDRKLAEHRQQTLLDELNHRVKNTLATVQSIAMQTSRTTDDASAFESAFLARISALAQAHDLLTAVAWEGASLQRVVEQILAPYVTDDQVGRVRLTGPNVRLGPNAAVSLAMAFHELATNAAKYGSLSTASGVVEVNWTADKSSEHPGESLALEIDWRESGGPPVALPSRRGFGSRFVEQALAREFDGVCELIFEPKGLRCHMRLPLSQKLQLAA